MKFSTRTRYALRLMLELAAAGGEGYVSLKDVAFHQGISIKYLEQIVSRLIRAGLVASSRGAQGGYRLTRTPAEYTTGDIIRAIEGGVAPVACLEHSPNACPRADGCATLGFWTGLQTAITTYIDTTTLADLLENTK
ncbi:MAG: Rrf2 family transcriptional regulator [Planctomycetaceae bacterium]|nr:Rrf2 family transcriptional regulator [Planctomycetaceae bacterium]